MNERLEKIIEACSWLLSKNTVARDSVTITTHVKWADWQRKRFSPVMAVLWRGEAQKNPDGYDTLWIPPSDSWHRRVAEHLHVDEAWVAEFVDQCYRGSSERYTMRVTFDGLSHDGTSIKNPKISWERSGVENVKITPEAKHCLENYCPEPTSHKIPYWTKNPPVEMYKRKLFAAAYDLFSAMNANE